MRRLLPCLMTILMLMTAAAHAATPNANPDERLDAKAEALMKDMDQNQARQFLAIRTAHGTLRAVEDVQSSLDRAVKSCTTANPKLSQPMTERFQEWKNAVLPVIRSGQSRLDKMILTQGFTRPSNVRAYLKAFDDVIAAQKNMYQEVPVSTLSACETLTKNMDQSQKVMGKLITETLGLDKELKTAE